MSDIYMCSVAELKNGESKQFNFNDKEYFVIKEHDRFYTYLNACPHLGVQLNWQENNFLDADKELIQCSMHGALFVIESGECVYGPCQGKRLDAVTALEKDGKLFFIN